MKNLKGTEKQIAYANDILNQFNDVITKAIEIGSEKYGQKFIEYRDKVNSMTEAYKIIDCSKTSDNYGIFIVTNMSDLKTIIHTL